MPKFFMKPNGFSAPYSGSTGISQLTLNTSFSSLNVQTSGMYTINLEHWRVVNYPTFNNVGVAGLRARRRLRAEQGSPQAGPQAGPHAGPQAGGAGRRGAAEAMPRPPSPDHRCARCGKTHASRVAKHRHCSSLVRQPLQHQRDIYRFPYRGGFSYRGQPVRAARHISGIRVRRAGTQLHRQYDHADPARAGGRGVPRGAAWHGVALRGATGFREASLLLLSGG